VGARRGPGMPSWKRRHTPGGGGGGGGAPIIVDGRSEEHGVLHARPYSSSVKASVAPLNELDLIVDALARSSQKLARLRACKTHHDEGAAPPGPFAG